jgi:hypothetical protein
MPGMAMLVLRVAFPASSGLPSGAVISSTNEFGPCFHCPDSLRSETTAFLVFWVCMTFKSCAFAISTSPAPSRPSARTITIVTRPMDLSL